MSIKREIFSLVPLDAVKQLRIPKACFLTRSCFSLKQAFPKWSLSVLDTRKKSPVGSVGLVSRRMPCSVPGLHLGTRESPEGHQPAAVGYSRKRKLQPQASTNGNWRPRYFEYFGLAVHLCHRSRTSQTPKVQEEFGVKKYLSKEILTVESCSVN